MGIAAWGADERRSSFAISCTYNPARRAATRWVTSLAFRLNPANRACPPFFATKSLPYWANSMESSTC